jgi:hypothetical protein
MLYKGLRNTVPHSRYGNEIMVIEATGWTDDEYNAQPWDMVTELGIRLQKRAIGEAYHSKHKGK